MKIWWYSEKLISLPYLKRLLQQFQISCYFSKIRQDGIFSAYYIFHSFFSSYNHTFLGWYLYSVFKSCGEFCYLGFKRYAGSSADGRQMSTTWEPTCMLREKFFSKHKVCKGSKKQAFPRKENSSALQWKRWELLDMLVFKSSYKHLIWFFSN